MIESSGAVDLIQAAIVALEAEQAAVTKGKENPFFKSKYADLGSVVEATKEQRAKHGLGVVQLPDFDGTYDLLTTRIVHVSGQWLQASMRLHLTKTDPQAQGSAITYARRYSYGGALGIVTEDDDDGAAASTGPRKRQGAKQSAAPHSNAASGSCPGCGGSGVRHTASGKDVPCPACSEGKEATKPVVEDDGDGGVSAPPPDPAADSLNRRRAAANAALAEVGIKGDDERHAAIREATDGACESTKALTGEQLTLIKAWCDRKKVSA